MNIHSKKIISISILITIFFIPFFVSGFEITDVNELNSSGLSKRSISTIISVLMNWLLALITILSIISLIVSGIFFILGGNDSSRVETAKNWLIYSIIGIIVSLSGYIIINLVYDLSKADPAGQAPSQAEEEINEEVIE